jgi:hypothetical protein
MDGGENDDTLDRRRLRRPDVGSDACGCAGAHLVSDIVIAEIRARERG